MTLYELRSKIEFNKTILRRESWIKDRTCIFHNYISSPSIFKNGVIMDNHGLNYDDATASDWIIIQDQQLTLWDDYNNG